jgi:DNA transformation protein
VTTPIGEAVNIGPVLGAELTQAGIGTLEELSDLGYRGAWEKLHAVSPDRDCAHSLLALAGAIRGKRWTSLPADERAAIRAEAKELS